MVQHNYETTYSRVMRTRGRGRGLPTCTPPPRAEDLVREYLSDSCQDTTSSRIGARRSSRWIFNISAAR